VLSGKFDQSGDGRIAEKARIDAEGRNQHDDSCDATDSAQQTKASSRKKVAIHVSFPLLVQH
jgi:hypothetical protein